MIQMDLDMCVVRTMHICHYLVSCHSAIYAYLNMYHLAQLGDLCKATILANVDVSF